MSISENIKALRDEHNITQAELGKIAGVSDKAVSTWENGTAEPRMGAIQKIADYFHITKSWIIEDHDSPVFEASAGEGRLNDGYPTEEYKIQLESDEVVVRVVGRSMEPTLQDGDIVVIVAQSLIDYPRQIALVKVNGEEATLKRVEIKEDGVMLIGDNIDVYPPHFFTAEEVEQLPVKIEGVVTKLIREIK